ncbi:hypothetical protein P9112_009987 [Eukaryota sp. TZLM1-RC]
MEPAEDEQQLQEESAIGQAQLPKDLKKEMKHMSQAGTEIKKKFELDEKKKQEIEKQLREEQDWLALGSPESVHIPGGKAVADRFDESIKDQEERIAEGEGRFSIGSVMP